MLILAAALLPEAVTRAADEVPDSLDASRTGPVVQAPVDPPPAEVPPAEVPPAEVSVQPVAPQTTFLPVSEALVRPAPPTYASEPLFDEPQDLAYESGAVCLPSRGWLPGGLSASRALVRTPDMLGDFFSGETLFVQTNAVVPNFLRADLPLAGGSRNVKIGEHNRALPTDRFYLLYQHFHRALRYRRALSASAPAFQTEEFSIDRYTLGFEKTFSNAAWSVELRMPLTDAFQYSDENPLLPTVTDFQISGGDVGNLAVISKRLLYANDYLILSGGVGLNLPTGSDVQGNLPEQSPAMAFSIRNESLHVLPFLGFTATEGERWFMHAFVQFDVAANGDRVEGTNASGDRLSAQWSDPTLFYLDIGFGYWLHHPPTDDGLLTGVAGLLEFHYAAPIHGDDQVPIFTAGTFATPNGYENLSNVAVGIHLELSPLSSLRGGFVFPVDSFPNRTFDAETQVSFIRRF